MFKLGWTAPLGQSGIPGVTVTDQTHPQASRALEDGPRLVSLNQRDVEEAARLLTLIAGANPADPQEQDQDDPLRARARQIYRDRRRRFVHFGVEMFGEPAWDMLLILYLEEGGQRQSQRRLAEVSGAPKSTAMRWIDYLDREGLVRVESHPTDKRRNFVALSDKGRQRLELFLSETGG